MMSIMIRVLAQLRGGKRGVTIVEFAFVAPVLVLTVMGILDLGYRSYTTAILQGAVQKAARDSTLEAATLGTAGIDNRVEELFHNFAPNAELTFTRSNYASLTNVGKPEDFTDTNGDNICNNGESFEDLNGNDTWDSDRGRSGVGSARDAVLYTATATYISLFPVYTMLGWDGEKTISASTVLINQPYGAQADREPEAGNCT